MDMDDDTAVFSTLKSFNSFISRPDPPLRPQQPENLQYQFKRGMELMEAADRVHSKTQLLQLDQEKKQMEMSHKRARFELERAATDSQRDLEREQSRNQELLGRMRRMEEREAEAARGHSEQVEANRALRNNLEGLAKKLEDRESMLNTANETISALQDQIRDLQQDVQNKESSICSKTLDAQALTEQLDVQRRKYQEVSQLCQSLQSAQSTCSEHIIKIKELERRVSMQEQDVSMARTMKTEAARVPHLDKELRRLREDNAYLRESRENSSLLKEEVEGLRRKLERMEKTKEELVNMELEKERLFEKLQAWENLGLSTGLNIRKPEDLSREVIQIQQREIALKEQNYTLTSRVRAVERSQSDLQGELSQQRAKALEEQNKRESQEAMMRRLQKRTLLLTKERDGMRSILESYDSELGSSEYSPQLSKRLREAEETLHKTQSHHAEMEAQLTKAQEETGSLKLQLQTVELELETVKKQAVSAADGSSAASKEEVNALRLKVEDLEAERQRLEEQNNILEMRLERNNLQGDYDPMRTRVLHFKMNPTSVAKQERQQEVEALQQEVTRLREAVRALQEGGAATGGALGPQPDDGSTNNAAAAAAAAGHLALTLPPSQEVLDLRKQVESSELKNRRLKEVFQLKIQEFRTVAYMLTGYQMDPTTENTYRLTSVYAEHQDDALLFKKRSGGGMELMETEFAKTLEEMVNLHLHHQKSFPAFLSAVTLDLFSRQTMTTSI